jgi:phytoene synthase
MPPEGLRAADFDACRSLLRAGSKSFSTASLLLPRRVRIPATVIYAFCRIADDTIDSDPGATEATVDALRERLRRAYAGRPDDDPVDRALAAVVEADRVPIALPEALLEGLAWDAAGRRYETLDDLYAYAARVAGTVGAMMTVVMGGRATNVLARACDLGVAMQLTNIARDVGEDAARGRIYLPLTWMREVGLDPDGWLVRPTANEQTRSLVARLLRSAEALYVKADFGIAALPPDCRVAIRAARLIYADIGRYVARAGFDSVSRRAVVPRSRKLWLLLRSFGARFARRRHLDAPPLGPTRFLVTACECEDAT